MTTAPEIRFTATAAARENGEEHFHADVAQLAGSTIFAANPDTVDTGDEKASFSAAVSASASPEIAIASEEWQANRNRATTEVLEAFVQRHIEDEAVSRLGVYLDISVKVDAA